MNLPRAAVTKRMIPFQLSGVPTNVCRCVQHEKATRSLERWYEEKSAASIRPRSDSRAKRADGDRGGDSHTSFSKVLTAQQPGIYMIMNDRGGV